MSFKQRPPENTGQNIGCDPNSNSSKRNSGLFSFLKWFKPSTSRESIDTDPQISHSSSCDSLNSSQSDGTVASFSFIAPGDYKNSVSEKYIALGPETDTYKARLKQRDKVREKDKNLTLRKKYNLFFNRDSIKPTKDNNDTIENSKSLPLITRGVIMEPQLEDDNNKVLHRRTNSESSKVRKAGSYVHVKGKRKAPQPPIITKNQQEDTLKRKKRIAPPPPTEDLTIISNDSLKLDHGVLKPVKEKEVTNNPTNNIIIEPPVSPRAWYKRNEKTKSDVPFTSLDLNVDDVKIEQKKEIEKRKSGMTFLTNISELDREAYEIIKNKDLNEMPEFMRPKNTKIADTEEWISPKRRSAKDLIAKFNAITNVKRSVFGGSHKDKLFEKQISLDETKRRQEFILENHKKRLEEIDNKKNLIPLMKSESASAIKINKKETTPKMERKCWICPKCNIDNDYWRIICHVCSTIKPYFDDFSSSSSSSSTPKENNNNQPTPSTNINFERSKTQIGFSALLNYNNNKTKPNSSSSDEKEDQTNKRAEEKEKLKKILIEMKNSLPKRNINQRKNNTSSIILENPEDNKNDEEEPIIEKTQEEKIAEILIGTTQTIYENIKVKKTDNPKPIKVSSSSQTTTSVKQHLPSSTITKLVEDQRNKPDFQLMQMKDFENIYSSQSSQSAAKMYANLVRNDELSLFFNIPKDVPKKDEKSTKLTRTDSLQINRLLKKLEISISKGELQESSIIARELALLKVNCSVVKNKTLAVKDNMKKIQIEMYVEDKISHRGPFPIDVIPEQTLLQLKNQVQKEFDIPVAYQRWILGKELITDDKACLKNHGITKEGCPVFLYLVAPDKPSTSETDLKLLPSTSKETTPPKVTESTKSTNNNKPPKISNLFKDRLESKNNQQLHGSKHTPKIVNVIPKVTELLMKPQEVLIEKESYKKETTPPKKETTPTKKETTPPTTVATPPKKETSPPTKETTTPIKQTSPKKESTPPTVVTTPIKQTSPKQESTPPIVVTTPIKIDTTPPIKVTSPAKKETSPLIKVTTPPKEITKIGKEVQKTTEKIEIKQTSSSTPIEILRVEIKSTEIPITVESVELKLQNTTDLQKPSTSTPIIFPDPKLEVKPIIQQVFPTLQENLNIPPKAKEEEDFSDYESKTLKPIKEWECHLCTLLNPITSNMCAVCSTIRLRIKTETKKDDKETKEESTSPQTYIQLLNLDNTDLIENSEPFTCLVCFIEIAPNDGVTLRECLHQFCKICLSQTIEFSDEAEVKCPFRDENYACNIGLQDREIKALVSAKVYEQHLAKSVAQAENKIDNSFHCKTPDCKGWCVYEDNVNEFKCPVCRRTNCLTCQAIHIGINCREWQEKIKDDANLDENGKKTKEMLEEMVKKGEAIECPTCRVILMKKWGCDWLRCSMCKTEICWVTRGPRWGPAGKGDTSGGCKCGVNGIKCHPKCNYCH